jgi:hypothetical protein
MKDRFYVISNPQFTYHRNGTSGNGFYVVLFDITVTQTLENCDKGDVLPMVAIVFKEKGNIAVMNRNLLGQGVFEFGANSWRAEDFEKEVRTIIGERI